MLSSIGSENPQPIVSKSRTNTTPLGGNDSAKATSSPVTNSSAFNVSSTKRKADDELLRPIDKLLRTESRKPTTANGVSSSTSRFTPSIRPQLQTSPLASSVPYRGTSKISPVTPTAPELKAPPKKGSYAEIMARSQGAQNTAPPVGVIKHKPKEKLSTKKELVMNKKGLAPNGKPGGIEKNASGSKSSSPGPAAQTRDGKLTAKKIPPASYTGTAKPKPQPSYKGTMKPVTGSTAPFKKKTLNGSDDSDRSTSRRPPTSQQRRQYSYADEESGEDEEEENYETASDLSNMEAGFYDVEEEDALAAKEAKKEDERELKVLEEHKKEKEIRKRKLEALSSKKAKK